MAKTILFAAACLLFGAVLTNGIDRYVTQQHQHTRAVMALARFHFERLESAARAGQCPAFNQERARLSRVYDELLQAFPLAYAQDGEFHKRADAFKDAIGATSDPDRSCAEAATQTKSIDDACDECHREYR